MGVFPCLSWPVGTARDHQEEPRLCLFQMVYHAAWGRMGLHFRGRQGLWNRNCRKESFRLQTFGACPLPSWASGSGGRAIRLKRGDVDWVSPHKAQERQYCDRVRAWIYHALSQAPSRCVPILCLDASGRVGQGESEPCIGPDHQAVENYNGRKLRELLSAQAMAAVNTFSQLATLTTDSLATTVELTICLPSTSLIGQSWGLQSLFCCRQTFTNHSCSWKKGPHAFATLFLAQVGLWYFHHSISMGSGCAGTGCFARTPPCKTATNMWTSAAADRFAWT